MRIAAALLGVLLIRAGPARAETPAPAPGSMKVCVYYDQGKDAHYTNGQLHAIMLENLLGHFREAAVVLSPAASYRPGELDSCDRAAYVASYFNEPLPPAFLADVASRRKPFLWINYNIGQLQASMGSAAFEEKAGFKYDRVTGFDKSDSTSAVPGFFRDVDYRGSRFAKMAARKADGSLVASPDIGLVKPASAKVLATAFRSDGAASTPYATEKDGFFYVADNPFLFIHEQDRYLVVADLLFDFLGLPPRGMARRALVRLEDIHPNYDLKYLYRAVDLLKARKVPFALSVIPDYVAPGAAEADGLTMDKKPEFLKALRYAEANGGTVLLHGYTHQVARLKGCAPLGTGADYEFWDRCRQTPLPNDSEAFALDRIIKAKALLEKSGFTAAAWVTPHYAASPADFRVFAREFPRTVQRVCYSFGWGPGERPEFVSQFFPYTIYKDHYGQFVWPENLGFVPMPGSDWSYATPDDIEASARLAWTVRDGWASFFWHPQLLATPGEAERLRRIIDGIRAQGYEFASLSALKARGE